VGLLAIFTTGTGTAVGGSANLSLATPIHAEHDNHAKNVKAKNWSLTFMRFRPLARFPPSIRANVYI
jgi:hypothetical protein